MKLTNFPPSADFMQSRIRPSNFPSIPHPGNNRRLIRLPPNPMLDPFQGTQFIKLHCVATTIEPCWVKHKKVKNMLSNWQFSCAFFGSPVFCHHGASSSPFYFVHYVVTCSSPDQARCGPCEAFLFMLSETDIWEWRVNIDKYWQST